MNIAEILPKTAERLPDKIAYYFNEKGTTFRELADLSNACALGLQERGVRKGDHVAIFTFNSLEFIVAWFGAVKLGAIVIPVNIMLKARESKYILENAEVSTLIVHRNQIENSKHLPLRTSLSEEHHRYRYRAAVRIAGVYGNMRHQAGAAIDGRLCAG